MGPRGKSQKSKASIGSARHFSADDISSDDGGSQSGVRSGRGLRAPAPLSSQVSVRAAEALSKFSRPQDQLSGGSPSPSTSFMEGPMDQPSSPICSMYDPAVIDQKFNAILAAFTSCQSMMVSKVDELRQDFVILRHETQKIKERTEEAERRISAVEDTLGPVPEQIITLQRQVRGVVERNDDLENRLRRNNIRLVGLPEKAEGSDPVAFLESWLPTVLPPDTFSPYFTVERAHRVPGRPPPPGGPPRPFLAKLLHFKDRDAILRAVRLKGDVLFNGSRVAFYPDFSVELRKQRARFTEVRSRLRSKGYQYAMLFPARLRVKVGAVVKFFTSPEDALRWVDAAPPAPPPD